MDAYPKAAMERAMRVQDMEVADAEEDRFGPICVFPFANISNALPKCQPLPVAQSRVECGLISRNGHQGSSFDPLTFHLARIPPKVVPCWIVRSLASMRAAVRLSTIYRFAVESLAFSPSTCSI